MVQDNKMILKGLNIQELKSWCIDNDLSRFRANQIYEWLYFHGVNNPDKMINISQKCRNAILDTEPLSTLNLISKTVSDNKKTIKYLFQTNDHHLLESVSMIDKSNRHTVCVSSQSGCNLGCDFCATAKMGLLKNLSAGEIIDQLIMIRSLSNQRIDNVVYMGMGEPFLNYRNVIKSAKILNDKKGFNISVNKITISTVGIVSKIKQFINDNEQFGLAISLNAPNDNIRNIIMPINQKWPIKELINVNKSYVKKNKRKKITFEYVLMDGINSSQNDALELVSILQSAKCKVNIIPYNETDGKYQRPSDQTINEFIKVLSLNNNNNFQIMVRWSNGIDIDAGCGQLAIKNNNKGD
tara:strand:- start:2264 stop:3325 length:1062 start_codon:yes stop_codon:yes gene_type:complete